jgi:hypothetical protein
MYHGFFRVVRFPPQRKLTVAEILLKVALNIIANHSQRNMYRYKNKSVLMDT